MGEKGRLIIYNFLSTKTDVLDNNAGFKEENKHRIYKLANWTRELLQLFVMFMNEM